MTDNKTLYDLKHIPMKDVLNALGQAKDKRGFYVCPYHSEATPSGKVTPEKNLFHCFGCGETKNNIDLVMKINNLSFPQAVEYLQQLQGVSPSVVKTQSLPSKKPESSQGKYLEALAKFRPYKTLERRQIKNRIDKHLEERGLKQAISTLHNNGYDIGGINGNIAYHLNGFFIIRYPDNKANSGSPKLSYLEVNKNDLSYFICEGITDALAAAEMGRNSIVLHSVNNVDRFINRLKEKDKAKHFNYIIATDNDTAGLKARDKLKEFMDLNNFNYEDYEPLRASKCKDLGELYSLTVN